MAPAIAGHGLHLQPALTASDGQATFADLFRQTDHELRHEAHIPAWGPQEGPHSRFPRPHGHGRRPEGPFCASRQGPQAPHPLTGSLTDSDAESGVAMPAAKFPRSARLLSKAGFDSAFGGVRRHSDLFTAHVRINSGERARLGLAIGRRVSKRAVDRNLLKRLVREAFRQIAASLPVCDLVVTAKPGAASATRAELRGDLDRLFRRVAALKPAVAPGTISAPDILTTPPGRASPPTE